MVAPVSTILCPVYFDETSPAALEYTKHFALRNDSKVYLLHVIPTDEFHLFSKVYHPETGGGANPTWAEKVAREQLEALMQMHLPGVQCEIVTRQNSNPATGILEAAKELNAALIVMTTHGRTGLSHLLLGSVAEKVARESRCPVFTTHRGEELAHTEPFRNILVPIDIAELSVAALIWAHQIARQFNSTVYPLHIVPTDETPLILRDVYQAREGTRANLVVAEKVARQKLIELANAHLPEVRHESILHVSSDPSRTILEVQKDIDADLIVMATHGLKGVFHLILGSLTEKMMREAHCPVLSLRQ